MESRESRVDFDSMMNLIAIFVKNMTILSIRYTILQQISCNLMATLISSIIFESEWV